jgi:hypothetical protein
MLWSYWYSTVCNGVNVFAATLYGIKHNLHPIFTKGLNNFSYETPIVSIACCSAGIV